MTVSFQIYCLKIYHIIAVFSFVVINTLMFFEDSIISALALLHYNKIRLIPYHNNPKYWTEQIV